MAQGSEHSRFNMAKRRFSLNDSLWIRGEVIDRTQRNAHSEVLALQARGAKVFTLKNYKDKEELQKLQRLLWQSDAHVILARLAPWELAALQPLLFKRKNFSFVVDDWWCMPHRLMRSADYIIFRNYSGIAVRLGQATLVEGSQPPVLFNPFSTFSWYSAVCAALRLPALAVSPAIDAWNYFRRRDDPPTPERYLYFPFPIAASDAPLQAEEPQYDFANTGGTCGLWLIRDPYASFRYTFANLYCDRQRLTDLIAQFEGKPFTFYDCRREKGLLPYDEYIRKNRQSRYLITTGGLQNTSVPKYLEYVCVGTPMIGRGVPFEYPWLDDCLFPVDAMRLKSNQLKPLLHEALDRYPVLHANCLNWRERLLKLYDINNLLDLLQAQANGEPIPSDYLRFRGAAEARANQATNPETICN